MFANRIESIIEDSKLYKKVQKNAKKDLATSWKDIALETYKYYLEVIDEYNKKDLDN